MIRDMLKAMAVLAGASLLIGARYHFLGIPELHPEAENRAAQRRVADAADSRLVRLESRLRIAEKSVDNALATSERADNNAETARSNARMAGEAAKSADSDSRASVASLEKRLATLTDRLAALTESEKAVDEKLAAFQKNASERLDRVQDRFSMLTRDVKDELRVTKLDHLAWVSVRNEMEERLEILRKEVTTLSTMIRAERNQTKTPKSEAKSEVPK